jgi:hypothetical protein
MGRASILRFDVTILQQINGNPLRFSEGEWQLL